MSETQVLSMELIAQREKRINESLGKYELLDIDLRREMLYINTVRHYQKVAEMSAGAHVERVKYSEELEDEVERLQAQCAAMREALIVYATRENWVNDMGDEFTRYKGWETANDALASTAGAQWLERYKRMERVVEAAREYLDADGSTSEERLRNALEETP